MCGRGAMSRTGSDKGSGCPDSLIDPAPVTDPLPDDGVMAIEPSGEDSSDVTVGDGVLVRPGGSAKIGS